MDSRHVADVILTDLGNAKKRRITISTEDGIELSIDDKQGIVAIIRYEDNLLQILTPSEEDFGFDTRTLKTVYG